MLHDSSSRRCFLKVLAQGSALAGAACLGAACSSGGAQPTGMISAGNVSALTSPSVSIVAGHALALGRDAGGVYAMTLICTHQACDIATTGTVTEQLITCSCHGSEYDANGAVVRGPAPSPLEHFEVTLGSAGDITVNADQTVPATTRVAVT